MTFAQAVLATHNDPSILPSNYRYRISVAIQSVLDQLDNLFPSDAVEEYESCDDLMRAVHLAVESLIKDEGECESVLLEFERAAEAAKVTSIEELVRAIEVGNRDIEQEIEKGKVNILSMHRAKGLTAEAVIVAACEDQYIPGRAKGDAVDDERRLLYVSLTRAKHQLFITYCDKRTGQQTRTGRPAGCDPITGKPFWRQSRTITRFLKDATVTPQAGKNYLSGLERIQL
jgi:superfamily I DNA/RNA helicase